jgi:5-methylcytosine-specific restriction endonuclease McrA
MIRSEAIRAGATRYTGGRPCTAGHAERFTSSGTCCVCAAATRIIKRSDTTYRQEELVRDLESRRLRYDDLNAKRRAQTLLDPSAKRRSYNKWRAANTEAARLNTRLWCAANTDRRTATQANRRAIQMNQRCGCCTNESIEEMYSVASLVGGEVDHRVPLALGGHHCCKNLQPLTVYKHSEKTSNDLSKVADAKRRNKLLASWHRA